MSQLELFSEKSPEKATVLNSRVQNAAKELIVYTDGGCHGNPGPGGWGCVIIDEATKKGEEVSFSGGEKLTTNNRMELNAVIVALSKIMELQENVTVSVYTDSQYVKNGITTWIKNWKKNGWKTADKKPVKNQELWISLDNLVQKMNVKWVWVKGHAGVYYNEVVDNLTQIEIAKFE